MELKALEILKKILKEIKDDDLFLREDFIPKLQIVEAIAELEDLNRNELQELFIKQELKHKKQIKELKIKFIEDIAFLKTGMNEKEMK